MDWSMTQAVSSVLSQYAPLSTGFYWEASDQKFKKNDGDTANQLKKAIAVADMNLLQ